MALIRLLHAKLHRLRVTDANINYVGSITIDPDLLNLVGILPLQEVEVWNATNGNRLTTYALPGQAGTGTICVNGAAAHLCAIGDIVIIAAYELRERQAVLQAGHQARVVIADAQNHCQELLEQSLWETELGMTLKTTAQPLD
ncbi:aspartate 1-decarboxylase [Thermosynechococcaceae cyanobacterium BACA0444]|uniref:Aspartate 1-decarboxylase n=1 Tax=Pseudocalidococcus azoricus BACA0444 TaxID=2918990 RepID=A0AAE4FS98_9CYAN|nr:aspartate 1-decarboxylase [Pseudocalidococcus azoricus]MDS3860016.1 aspartate 1-decarboxylase [Pseudocalidococcus azoricus BACA0444]